MRMNLVNQQPPERLFKSDGQILDYVGCFNTIQGEGPFSGCPATFIRLAGCTMQCPGCDTDYTSMRRMIRVNDLVEEAGILAIKMGAFCPLFVITGGEPFRQNTYPLVNGLLSTFLTGYVQIETSGTADLPPYFTFHSRCMAVCSPKAGKIAAGLPQMQLYYKYPLRAGHVDPEDGLPTDILGTGVRPARPPKGTNKSWVYVLPEDEGEDNNCRNLQACVESSMKFGYTLQVQLHKLCKLP